MLRYFVSQINVRSQFIESMLAGDPEKAKVLSEIRHDLDDLLTIHPDSDQSLSTDDAWTQAYYLERRLALIEPNETLISEVERRLDEAEDEKISCSSRLRSEFGKLSSQTIDTTLSPPSVKVGSEPRLRFFLLNILEELHWAFQRKFHSRPIQKSATRRLVSTGLAAAALFVFPYIWIYVAIWTGDVKYTLPIEQWAWLPLWTTITAGYFGAMFSRLLYLQMNWNDLSLGALKDTRDFSSVLLRGAVGMTGAIVVYYFLLSGVIGGGLFSDFQKMSLHQLSLKEADGDTSSVPLRLILPNKQLALLVVWSFLAGFSERLVPSILQNTESSIGESAGRPAGTS